MIIDQQVFDAALFGIRSQNYEPALVDTDDGRDCMYRCEDGRKCAIGWSIPDEVYTSEMEGLTVDYLLPSYPALKELYPGVRIPLLKELQECHDGMQYGQDIESYFENKMLDIANYYGLKYTPVNEKQRN